MNKIIAAIDGLRYSESTTKYAVALSKQNDAHLIGVLLDDFTYHSYALADAIEDHAFSSRKINYLDNQDRETRNDAAKHFAQACVNAKLSCCVHHDRKIALQELIRESIYADVLVISKRECVARRQDEIPTHFMKDLLSEVQCSVLAVPTDYKPINKLTLLYDGTPASVYAIRMISLLFPSFKRIETEVVTVLDVKDSAAVADKQLMKEFMLQHFPDARYKVLKGNPEKCIVEYLQKEQANTLVVLGAYRRGMVSRWFKPSMADTLMKELDVPLFIAHN